MAREPAAFTPLRTRVLGATEAAGAGSADGPRSRRTEAIRRPPLGVLGVNLLIAGAKFGHGIIRSSAAITADAMQSLLDGPAGLAATAKPPVQAHDSGHVRYETLAGERLGVAGADAAVSLLVAGVIGWTMWHPAGSVAGVDGCLVGGAAPIAGGGRRRAGGGDGP